MTALAHICAVVAAVALAAAFFWQRRRANKLYAKLAEQTKQFEDRETERTDRVDALREQLEREEREARFQRRRAGEFFAIIEGVEGERDTWKRMWRDTQQTSSAAQQWLLRDLERAVLVANGYAARLRRLGEKAEAVRMAKDLEQILEHWRDTPAEPAHVDGKKAMVEAEEKLAEQTPGPEVIGAESGAKG